MGLIVVKLEMLVCLVSSLMLVANDQRRSFGFGADHRATDLYAVDPLGSEP